MFFAGYRMTARKWQVEVEPYHLFSPRSGFLFNEAFLPNPMLNGEFKCRVTCLNLTLKNIGTYRQQTSRPLKPERCTFKNCTSNFSNIYNTWDIMFAFPIWQKLPISYDLLYKRLHQSPDRLHHFPFPTPKLYPYLWPPHQMWLKSLVEHKISPNLTPRLVPG